MKEQINQLITRLLDDSLAPGETLPEGTRFDSSKTVAAKEIKLLSAEAIPVLKELILTEKNKDRKSKACSMLTSLSKEFNDVQPIYYLIDLLDREKSKNFISLQLLGIYWTKVPLHEKQEILIRFSYEKDSGIRHSAINMFENYESGKKQLENRLIEILETSTNSYDLTYTNAALAKIGSKKAIGPLKKVIIGQTKTDVLSTAFNALGILAGADQLDFYIEMMSSKKEAFIKYFITKLISEYTPDNRAVDGMIERVKTILAKPRKTNFYYLSGEYPELVHALMYLQKYKSDDARIPALEKWILEKKVSFLDETEKKWIFENFQE